MISFKILNKEGNALTMEEIDKEVAKFWGKEVDPKWYANPYKEIPITDDMSVEEQVQISMKNSDHTSMNWFDILGFAIANQTNYSSGWKNVVHTMVAERIGEAVLDSSPLELPTTVDDKTLWSITVILDYYRPFVELAKHFDELGYTPVVCEDCYLF